MNVLALRAPAPPLRHKPDFSMGLATGFAGDVVVLGDVSAGDADRWHVVRALHQAGWRAVCAWPDPTHGSPMPGADPLAHCRAVLHLGEVLPAALRGPRAHGLPVWPVRAVRRAGAVHVETCDGVPLADALAGAAGPRPQPYAFIAARIHDDCTPLRSAIGTVVERELGMPAISFEDRRVVTNLPGVRERTCELIRRAAFFVADLSFSPSNPNHDSPNVAHEIGIACACGVPLVVSASLPRRNLYFAAGDLDTLFWHDAADLAGQLRAWLAPRRHALGCRVLNAELSET